MSEVLAAHSPIDEQMTDLYVADQITLMEQRESHVTPIDAYDVGHVALGRSVEISEGPTRPPEAHVREFVSESWRHYTPFNQQNAETYGSEAERMEAVAAVRNIANQARMTNKYFDGRHKRLGKQLDAGEISQDEHDQAVGEIVAGLALSNPQHLRSVGEAQRAAIDRRVKAGALPEGTQFVDVVSKVGEDGKMELAGIDKVVAKMVRAENPADLANRGLELKTHFYGEEAIQKASMRHEAHQEALRQMEAEVFEREVRQTFELIDQDDKAAKEKSKKKKADVVFFSRSDGND
jgi:hypothetical protein